MRWIAALLVFAYHMTWAWHGFPSGSVDPRISMVFSKAGWLGVSFFFVLSGFVLCWSYRSGDRASAFWRRRLVKVYPNHAVTFVLAALLLWWTGQSSTGVVQNLLLVQSWWVDPSVTWGMNGVSWSLSCELFFYALFPLWIVLVRRVPVARLWLAAVVLVLGVVLVPFLAHLLPADPFLPWHDAPTWQNWFVDIFPVTRSLEFVLGMVLARIVAEGLWIGTSVPVAALTCVVGYVTGLFVPFLFSLAATTVVPVALLIASGAAADVAGRWTGLAGPAWVRLGTYSFAFYLLHRLVFEFVVDVMGPSFWTGHRVALGVLVILGLTLLAAAALYTLVERPLERRFGSRRHRPSDPGPVAPSVHTGTGGAP